MRKIPGEYIQVSRLLRQAGMGPQAVAAHATPITREFAIVLTELITGITPIFRGYRGRANKPNSRHVRGHISLPAPSGVRYDGVPYLRLGIVLHECAHILAWRSSVGTKIRPHGEKFCETLAELLRVYTPK